MSLSTDENPPHLRFERNQEAHGFTVGTVITPNNDGGYSEVVGPASPSTFCYAIVDRYNADRFRAITGGRMKYSASFAAGSKLYLGEAGLTTVAPSPDAPVVAVSCGGYTINWLGHKPSASAGISAPTIVSTARGSDYVEMTFSIGRTPGQGDGFEVQWGGWYAPLGGMDGRWRQVRFKCGATFDFDDFDDGTLSYAVISYAASVEADSADDEITIRVTTVDGNPISPSACCLRVRNYTPETVSKWAVSDEIEEYAP